MSKAKKKPKCGQRSTFIPHYEAVGFDPEYPRSILQPEFAEQRFAPSLADRVLGQEAAALFTPADRAEVELAGWWMETAAAEVDQTVAKAIEYGSTDLIDIGRSLARVAGRELDDATAAEWGVFFYLEGKLSRWRSAIERGDRPSDDTLLDIGVYARMAQRIRYAGGWPGRAVTTPGTDAPGYNRDARTCCAYHNAKDQEQ